MSKKELKPFLKDKLYIPVEMVEDLKEVKKEFEVFQFDEKICIRCECLHDRPCSFCANNCQGFIAKLKTWGKKEIDGHEYIYVPFGNAGKIKRVFDLDIFDTDQVEDKRPDLKFDYPIKFTGKLRDGSVVNGVKTVDQKQVAKDYLDYGYGLIRAPARSGKTVLATYISCKLGRKTVVVAKQTEFLENFYKTYMTMTNVPELEKEIGHPIVKVIEDIEEIKDCQVALITYQKFIRDDAMDKIAKYINGRFSTVIIDECHSAAAGAFAKFTNRLIMKYRLGLSATPLRKDGRDCLVRDIIGPVVAEAGQTGMIPCVELVETGCHTDKYQTMGVQANWVWAMKWLYSHPDRNKMIVKQVFRDLNKGHKCILIPTDHKKHMNELVEMIRKKAKHLAKKGKLLNGEPIDYRNFVEGFYSGCNRQKILNDADSGLLKVVVAVRSMIKEGIDIKAPSAIYIQTPMSASPQPIGSPFFYQLANRVCTPYEGKKQPVIRIFVDDLGQSLNCLKSLFTHEIFPNLKKGPKGENPRYCMNGGTSKRIFDIILQIRKKNYVALNREERFTKYYPYLTDYDRQKGIDWKSYKDLS